MNNWIWSRPVKVTFAVVIKGQQLLFPTIHAGFILSLQPFSRCFSPTGHCCQSTNKLQNLSTLQIQVFGSSGGLCGDLGVNLDSVEVVGVPGDNDVVPVVVIQWLVGVAFDQMGSISQVGHIVQVTRTR